MAVTYGFYNALAHDRVYDAIQMSSIFDGIIRDGVFSTIGESLICKAPESGLVVNVGAGRAWFNHTWTLNDTDYPVEAEQAEVVLDRIDAIVLEVNSAVEVRANSIKFIKGTPSSNPVRPTLTHNAEVNQYALAYVSIRAGQTTIFQEDITNVVGTDETPFVTGLLQQLSIENLILQWENEFDRHFADFVATNESEFNTWSAEMQAQYTSWMNSKMAEYAQWYANMQAEGDANLAEFDAWFQHMKDQLDSDAAGHLQAEIDQLALEAGKGSVLTVHTINTSLYGRTVTVRQNEQIQTALFDNTGTAVFNNMPYIGEISITSTDGTQTATTTMNIPYFGRYTANIAFWAATVNINTTSSEFYGLTVTVAKDGVAAGTAIFDNAGHTTYTAMAPGSYKFTVNYDGMDFDSTIAITEEVTYTVILNAWTATLDIVTSVSELYTRPVTIKKGETIVGTTNFDGSGNATYKVHQTGTYTIVSTDTGGNTYQESVVVTDETVYEVSLGLPNGETALPVNDIGIWLQCAEILNKNYTTLAEVLADDECFAELLGNSNACAYMARSTAWAKAEGLVPAMTDDTHPSGVCSATTPRSGYEAYKAFDNVYNTAYYTDSNLPVNLTYHFPSAIAVRKFKIAFGGDNTGYTYSVTYKVRGSQDNSTWVDLGSYTDSGTVSNNNYHEHSFSNSTEYSYYQIYITDKSYTFTYSNGAICSLQFYTDADITTNSNAMDLLGMFDVACKKLLSNATWAEAIALSDYWDSVLNASVPVMTSNTTPEGTTYYDNVVGGYTWFDNNDSTKIAANQGSGSHTMGYEFPQNTNVLRAVVKRETGILYTGATKYQFTAKIQATSDGTNFEDVSDEFVFGVNDADPHTFLVSGSSSYKQYRLWISGPTLRTSEGDYRVALRFIQFYGRKNLSDAYIPLIPTMTSNTTPEGTASATSVYNGDYAAWKGFNGSDSDQVLSAENQNAPWEVKYEFANPITNPKKVVYRYGITYGNAALSYKVQLRKVSDSSWVDIASESINPTTSGTYVKEEILSDLTDSYDAIRFYVDYATKSSASSASGTIYGIVLSRLQIYSQYTKGLIHSAANDTLYYSNAGTNVPVATTDADGNGEIDFAALTPGTYTLYSTVAKDISNTSNPFSMQVHITKNTKEVYLMPLRFLYWYGKERYERTVVKQNNANNRATFNTYNFELYGYLIDSTHFQRTEVCFNKKSTGFSKLCVGVLSTNARNACSGISTSYPNAVSAYSIVSNNMSAGLNEGDISSEGYPVVSSGGGTTVFVSIWFKK